MVHHSPVNKAKHERYQREQMDTGQINADLSTRGSSGLEREERRETDASNQILWSVSKSPFPITTSISHGFDWYHILCRKRHKNSLKQGICTVRGVTNQFVSEVPTNNIAPGNETRTPKI